MQDYIYSSAAFVAMVIHLIINSGFWSDKGKINMHGICEYRVFLKGTFTYYIVDASWGILAGLRWTGILHFDTILYYLAIGLSVLTWCHFAIAYLNLNRWKARMISWFGYALLAFYIALSVFNSFNSCLFHFDAQGNYTAGPMRCFIFYPLIAATILMAGFAFVKTVRNRDSVRRRNKVVFLFCLAMAVAIVLQLIWPLWPYYAIGLLIGNCFFHIFVVEDERNELRLAVIEREQTAKHMAELEKALDRAREAEKAKSMFFSIVSHDIRTPLNAILGYSELLQDGIESKPEKEEALKSIRASGTTLLQLVNDVLDLAKMDSEKMTFHPEPVRLTDLTDEVFASFRMAANAKGIELRNKTAGLPLVLLDEHRFRQILFNLVGNAVKFTKKGSVTVAASYDDEKNLEVSVSDTGCGIAADMLERILDPFVQVHDPSHSADRTKGTGLGLSICHRLIEAMGGKLIVESELEKGSTFRARIPKIASKEETPDRVDEPKPVVLLKKLPKHVLIIDDSPVNRKVLTAFLKKAGIEAIDQACDGGEALAELDLSMKAGKPFDFVLSDLWMPNVNGLEFIEKLRADSRFIKLPVYALTADTESHSDSRTDLFTGILLKPITYDKLMEVFALTV